MNAPDVYKRQIIEAAFYGNNVIEVVNLKQAYELAKNSPGTIVTDMPVYRGEEFGLKKDTKVLLFNDGSVTGRCAAARRIAGSPNVDTNDLDLKVMDAIYDTRKKTMYHAEVYIGLDPEFMVKAHLLIPEGEENILYSWMLNFQYESDEYNKMYKKSRAIGSESDIYIFSDPQWSLSLIHILLTTSINGWIIEEKTVNKNPGDQSSPGVFLSQWTYFNFLTPFIIQMCIRDRIETLQ